MTETPQFFAQRPNLSDALSDLAREVQPGDLLSELLWTVRLTGEGAVRLSPRAPFVIAFGEATAMLYIFTRGGCELHIPGHAAPWPLRDGDIVLVPRPERHTISSGSGVRVRGPERGDLLGTEDHPGRPRWLAAWFALDAPSGGQMLAELPSPIVLTAMPDRSLPWFDVSRQLLLEELESPTQGSAAMISRILDLLFIQIIRAWAGRPDADPGWMAGATDPQVGRALSAIHADPGRAWTVATLADVAHLSRSTFAQRFTERIGDTPAAYLAQLRLEIAGDQLRATADPINLIAADIGYRSSAAFTRAFAKRYGVTPKQWRAGAGAPRG